MNICHHHVELKLESKILETSWTLNKMDMLYPIDYTLDTLPFEVWIHIATLLVRALLTTMNWREKASE
ncbi:hypothetical protein GmHk_09G024688 [Glycine max]|nr:hypothetical protein GmHk_09G024688 [Glycine max]